MAERRMFAKTIIDSDAFLEMPMSSQLLYFHLSMRADDEGFINKPKTIMRMVGSKDDDMNVLISRKFIIPFESGVVVIKHWRIHNYIQKDRYIKTKYQDELSELTLDENGSYRKSEQDVYSLPEECIQITGKVETQVRLGKVSIGKDNKKSTRTPIPFGQYQNVKLTQDEYEKLGNNRDVYVQFLDEYIEEKNYKAKNHYLTIKRWVIQAVEERSMKNGKPKRQDILPTHSESEGITEDERNELFTSLGQLGKK